MLLPASPGGCIYKLIAKSGSLILWDSVLGEVSIIYIMATWKNWETPISKWYRWWKTSSFASDDPRLWRSSIYVSSPDKVNWDLLLPPLIVILVLILTLLIAADLLCSPSSVVLPTQMHFTIVCFHTWVCTTSDLFDNLFTKHINERMFLVSIIYFQYMC